MCIHLSVWLNQDGEFRRDLTLHTGIKPVVKTAKVRMIEVQGSFNCMHGGTEQFSADAAILICYCLLTRHLIEAQLSDLSGVVEPEGNQRIIPLSNRLCVIYVTTLF